MSVPFEVRRDSHSEVFYLSDVFKRVVVQLVIVAKWIALACSTSSHLEVLNFRWGKQLGHSGTKAKYFEGHSGEHKTVFGIKGTVQCKDNDKEKNNLTP